MASGVRFTAEGIDLLCSACRGWYPAGLSFWDPHKGLGRCKACIREGLRLKNLTPAARASRKRYYEAHRDQFREYQRNSARARREQARRAVQALTVDERVLRTKI